MKKERVTHVHAPPSVRRTVGLRGAAVTIGLLTAAGLLFGVAGSADAAPQPTLAQVQQRLNRLDLQASKLGQQFDQVKQELAAAHQQLALLDRQAARYRVHFQALQDEISKIAITDYENGTLNSSVTLLTSRNPQTILDESSILSELSSANSDQINAFLAAARQLSQTQETAKHASAAIGALKRNLDKRDKELQALIAQQQALLAQLTPAQQTQVGAGPPPPKKKAHYHGPTGTQGERAVQYAYDQIGCPYVWGGIGPCLQGFDCSGLVMEAWAYAGISIPRTSYDDWADLPHVSTADLQPGDILVFAGASHVALYVGGGYLIQAPVAGQDVQKVALSGWYTANLNGAVRP